MIQQKMSGSKIQQKMFQSQIKFLKSRIKFLKISSLKFQDFPSFVRLSEEQSTLIKNLHNIIEDLNARLERSEANEKIENQNQNLNVTGYQTSPLRSPPNYTQF